MSVRGESGLGLTVERKLICKHYEPEEICRYFIRQMFLPDYIEIKEKKYGRNRDFVRVRNQ